MKRIPLTRGYFALVDDADFETVSQFKWWAEVSKHTVYAVRSVPAIKRGGHNSSQKMHRYLTGVTDPKIEVDHEDGNGLNNQRYNLRPTNKIQNQRNRANRPTTAASQFKGVTLDSRNQRWQARIQLDSKRLHLGMFPTEHAAALAYDVAAREHFGEFANTNF
jgi:hypothetical protein